MSVILVLSQWNQVYINHMARLCICYIIFCLLVLKNIALAYNATDGRDYIDLRDKVVNAAELKEVHEKVKLGRIGHIYWGAVPQELTGLKKEIDNLIIQNNKDYKRYASDFIHGLLAAHVYTNVVENENVSFSEEDEKYQYNRYLEHWKVYKVYNYMGAGGYYGVLYVNDKDKQLLLAHRGTIINWQDLLKTETALKADIRGILGGDIIVQQAAAYKATKLAIIDASDRNYNFSITGHSLGAWLAELSLFFIFRDFVEIKAKAVTFDSPGSVMHVEQFKSNIINNTTDFDISSLDITTYLSPPNFVNSCNKHIGRVYQIFPERDIPNSVASALTWYQRLKSYLPWSKQKNESLEWVLSIFDHSLVNILSTFNPITGKPTKYEEVLDWPIIKYTPSNKENSASKLFSWISSISIISPDEVSTLRSSIKDSTIMSLVHILSELATGKINQTQYLSYFKHIQLLKQHHDIISEKLYACNEFYLHYEGHYKTKLPNMFEDQLDDTNKGSNDWYLKQVKKKDVYQLADELSRQQLQEIKSQYKIVPSTKHFIISDKMPIEDLREWIYRLVQVNPTVKAFLEDIQMPRPSETIQTNKTGTLTSYIPWDRVKYLVVQESLNTIQSLLNQEQKIIITGLPGSGKSSYALEYAHAQRDKFIVRWFNADCVHKVAVEYHNLANELGINTQLNHNKQLRINLVNSKFANLKMPLLLVFDDVVEYEYIKDYLLNLPSNVKVIITTNNLSLINELGFKCIKLGPLSRDFVVASIKKSLSGRVSPNNIEKLANILTMRSGKILPYKLSEAIAYIENNPLLTTEQFIKYLKDNRDFKNETTMLVKLLKADPLAISIIQYAARLNPAFIDIDIFKEILMVDYKVLQRAIKVLNALGLIEITGVDRRGIKIHSLIQEEILAFTEKNAKSQYIIEEEILHNRLLTALNSVFPTITHIPDENWSTAAFTYQHVKKILKQKISKNLAMQAELYTKLARYYLHTMNNFKKRFKYEERALKIRRSLYNDNHPAIAESLVSMGFAYMHLGEMEKALTYHQQALEMKQAIYKSNHPSTADSLYYIANFYKMVGDHENAVKFHERALKIRQALYFENHRAILISLNDLGKAYKGLGSIDKALALHEKALTIGKRIYGDIAHPDIAAILNGMGGAYRNIGKLEQALSAHKQALSILEALYEVNHRYIIDTLKKIGITYEDLGDMETALIYLRKALKFAQEIYQGDHKVTAALLYNIGKVLRKVNDLENSLDYYEQALGMIKRVFPGSNMYTARILDGIGTTYAKLGDTKRALEVQYAGLKIRQELHSNNNPEAAKSLHSIGKTYQVMGELQKALEYYQQALNMRQTLYKGNHYTIAETIAGIASVYQNLGKQDEASVNYKNAYEIFKRCLGSDHPKTKKLKDKADSMGKNEPFKS
jgi:tetratricopeptide (TPR) repeat protein